MRAFTFILFLVASLAASSQEKPFFREHFLNRYLLNPAVAGIGDCTMAHLTDHHQWLDVQNAPMSQTLSLHGSTPGNNQTKHGFGGILYNDMNGAHRKTGGQFTYAYHVMLNERQESYLSFGVSAALYQYALDETSFQPYNNGDPLLSGSMQKTIMPNANAGVYYNSKTLFGGISAANLLPQGVVMQEEYLQPELKPVYAVIGGYRFGSDQTGMALEPSAAFILKENFEKNININARVLFPFMWLGLAYNHNLDSQIETHASVTPILGININNFFIAYAHEIGLGEMQSVHYGSPFVKIGMRFCNKGTSASDGAAACPAYW